jgi:murein DD-endopeptidase MepM/ murein hydrolase activator NlpD
MTTGVPTVPPAVPSPAPDTRRDLTVAPRRSPLLVRALLLGACSAGLIGLGLPGGASSATTLTAVSSLSDSSEVVIDPVQHGIVVSKPRPAQRATRTRPLAAKKPVATKVVAKKASSVRRISGWARPSGASVISPYGQRWGRMHKGIDFGAHYGAPIYAIGDGVVVGTGYQSGESGYGQITIIRHSNGFYSAYAHQSSMLVHAGETVHAGELIGRVGSTGHVTGPHLHFEIRTAPHGGQINPRTWLRSHGVYV